jgi:hypothetical protein
MVGCGALSREFAVKRLTLTVVVVVLVLCFASKVGSPRTAIAMVEEAQADIYESLFRYQFERSRANSWPGDRAFFVSVEEKDLPAAFLRRFAGYPVQVHQGSQYVPNAGLLFSASSKIKRLADGSVRVRCGERSGGSGSVSVFTLIHKNGKWVVSEAEGIMVYCGRRRGSR